MAEPSYALSIKQPWAALLVHGLKSIEVRRWSTPRRGRILVHAARIPDPRDEAWVHVPRALRAAARQLGGIIGAADLCDCKTYRNRDDFNADRPRHLNDPAWFQGPALYGFVFGDREVLPFRSYSGWMRFFPVAEPAPAAPAEAPPPGSTQGWFPGF